MYPDLYNPDDRPRLTQRAVEWMNGWAVHLYKIIGFLFLAFILFGLLGYVSVNLFYMFDRRWVTPMILTANHERVLELGAERARRRLEREEMALERQSASLELEHIERKIASHEAFVRGIEGSLVGDAALLRNELRSIERTIAELTDPASAGVTEEYAEQIERTTAAALEAGLVDRSEELARRYTLSRVAAEGAERKAKLRALRADALELERRITALGSVRGGSQPESSDPNPQPGQPLTYEAVLIDRERRAAELEIIELEARKAPLEDKIAAIDASLRDYDRMLEAGSSSPFLRALEERVAVAFVPYENRRSVVAGEALYACELGLLWCTDVGQVVAVLDGETAVKHPLQNRELRGVIAEIEVHELQAAEHPTLHAGAPPLLF